MSYKCLDKFKFYYMQFKSMFKPKLSFIVTNASLGENVSWKYFVIELLESNY